MALEGRERVTHFVGSPSALTECLRLTAKLAALRQPQPPGVAGHVNILSLGADANAPSQGHGSCLARRLTTSRQQFS